MFKPTYNINKLFTSALALSFLLGANLVQADPLFIKADGNRKNPEIAEQFRQLEKKSKSMGKFESALASFQMAEMLIGGFYDNGHINGILALEQYENVVNLLRMLPHSLSTQEEKPCCNCVPPELFDQLRKTKVAAINRLTDLYLKREQSAGSKHVCEYENFEKARALHESIVGDQKDLYTADEHAEAYFQLGLMAPKGSRKYSKFLERAAALNHADAVSTLANYAKEKATKLHEALRGTTRENPVYDSLTPEQRTRLHTEIFVRFTVAQMSKVKKLDLIKDEEFLSPSGDGSYVKRSNYDQFLPYAIGRLVKREMNQAMARCTNLESLDQLGLEDLRLKNKITAISNLDYVALACLYRQEAERLHKRAAVITAAKLEEKAPAGRSTVRSSKPDEDTGL